MLTGQQLVLPGFSVPDPPAETEPEDQVPFLMAVFKLIVVAGEKILFASSQTEREIGECALEELLFNLTETLKVVKSERGLTDGQINQLVVQEYGELWERFHLKMTEEPERAPVASGFEPVLNPINNLLNHPIPPDWAIIAGGK